MTYGSRTPGAGVPSGGALTKPIVGQGKLTVGRHRLSVLSARKVRPGKWDVVLADPANHCHLESVADWPLDLAQGEVEAEIGLSAGYAVARDGGVFYGVDTTTRAQVTDRHPTVQAVYDQAFAAGHSPCTTQLKAYRRVQRRAEWVKVEPPIHLTASGQPAAMAQAGDTVPAQPGTGGATSGPSESSGGGRADPPGLRDDRPRRG